MKRTLLTVAVAGGLLIPSAVLITGSAGAANPHGPKADPNAGCNGQGQGATCSDPGLTQSNGCNSSSAAHNPHCTVGTTGITPAPTTPPAAGPANQTGQGQPGKNAQGVAGQQGGGTAERAATAANPAQTIDQLPFTGLDTLWLALAGVGLLVLGLVLRVRPSSPDKAANPAPSSPVRSRTEAARLSLSEFGTLGLLLVESGHAQLKVGPYGAVAVLE